MFSITAEDNERMSDKILELENKVAMLENDLRVTIDQYEIQLERKDLEIERLYEDLRDMQYHPMDRG